MTSLGSVDRQIRRVAAERTCTLGWPAAERAADSSLRTGGERRGACTSRRECRSWARPHRHRGRRRPRRFARERDDAHLGTIPRRSRITSGLPSTNATHVARQVGSFRSVALAESSPSPGRGPEPEPDIRLVEEKLVEISAVSGLLLGLVQPGALLTKQTGSVPDTMVCC